MSNFIEKSAQDLLSQTLTRRDLIANSSLLLADSQVDKIKNHVTAFIPSSISEAFTPSDEHIYDVYQTTVSMTALTGRDGFTSSAYSLISDGSLQKVDFDEESGMYQTETVKSNIHLSTQKSISGFADYQKPGNELLIVGGNVATEDPYKKTAAIAVSPDSGVTFTTYDLEQEDGTPIHGIVNEIKRIPSTDKSLLVIGHEQSAELNYGIYDVSDNSFSLVTHEDTLPFADDLFVDPDNPTILFGAGRLPKIDEQGHYITQGINQFAIDLETSEVVSSETIFPNVDQLDDIHVVRAQDGTPQKLYALQSFDDGIFIGRNLIIHEAGEDESDVAVLNYDILNRRLVSQIDRSIPVNENIVREGVSVTLKNVQTVDTGVWLSGNYHSIVVGERPFATFAEFDEEKGVDLGNSIIFDFDNIRKFPSDLIDDLELVKFHNQPEQENRLPHLPLGDEATYGVLFQMQTCGSAMILTDQDYTPLDKPIIYQNR